MDLNRDQILGTKRPPLTVERVLCPELGGEVLVGEWTGSEADAFDAQNSAVLAREKAAAVRAKTAAPEGYPMYATRTAVWCVCDLSGVKLLLVKRQDGTIDGAATEALVEQFAASTPNRVIQKLYRAARRVNGLSSATEIEDAVKNSDGSRDGGSGSSSPAGSASSAGPT